MSELRRQINTTLSRLSKAMSRSEAASLAGKASAAARRAKAGGGAPEQTTDFKSATDKANRLIAANPGKYGPKGAKGKGKAKAGKKGKKAADPAAAKAKAAKEAQSKADHDQRQKEHAEDRAQHQADREQHAKEHAQSQSEHAQSRAEHAADRAQRQKQQAERAKQQAQKQKQAKTKAGAGKKTSSPRDTGKADAKAQEATERQGRLNTAAASRVGAALASGGKVNSGDAARLVGAGLARQNGADLELTPEGQSLLGQKMAKRARARAWEAEMLAKAESDYSPATRAKRKAYDNARPNKHPGKTAQRQAVRASIERGDRAPASTRKCAYCGKQADQYHHTNYTRKSGNVKPICASCNTRLSHQDEARKLAKRVQARVIEVALLTKANLPNLAQNAEQSLQKYL